MYKPSIAPSSNAKFSPEPFRRGAHGLGVCVNPGHVGGGFLYKETMNTLRGKGDETCKKQDVRKKGVRLHRYRRYRDALLFNRLPAAYKRHSLSPGSGSVTILRRLSARSIPPTEYPVMPMICIPMTTH